MSDLFEPRRVKNLLDSLANAFGGSSQYSNADVGRALVGQSVNNGLEGGDEELSQVAAALLAQQWSWTQETEDQHAAEILQAIAEERRKRQDAQAREDRKRLRWVGCEEVDREMETCKRVVYLLGQLIGDMRLLRLLPRIAGMALACAMRDGDLDYDADDPHYDAEKFADFASGALWPDRYKEGFKGEQEVRSWVLEMADACEVWL